MLDDPKARAAFAKKNAMRTKFRGRLDITSASEAGEVMDDAIWTGPVQLFWRTDCFGHKDMALFVGGLHVGSIMRWTGQDNPRAGEWRAWIMTDDDGRAVGWYRTEQEAKDALVDTAIRELVVGGAFEAGWRAAMDETKEAEAFLRKIRDDERREERRAKEWDSRNAEWGKT